MMVIAYSLELDLATALLRAPDVVDLKVELRIKLVLNHTSITNQAVVRQTED